MHTQDGNRDLKDDMINLSKFRMIADIISEIKLYQNERYNFTPEDSIQVKLHVFRLLRGFQNVFFARNFGRELGLGLGVKTFILLSDRSELCKCNIDYFRIS